MRFTRAIVRPPGANFASGLTSGAGEPDLNRAMIQHDRYCQALATCGLEVIALRPDLSFPDGTFIEDTAVLIPGAAIIARPGAPSRQGETASVRDVLQGLLPQIHDIEAPGTVDGGDVCQAGTRFFVGVSARTNEHGAGQLARLLEAAGYRASLIDIRSNSALLHLKSGISYLNSDDMVLNADAPPAQNFTPLRTILLPAAERYAANCVHINDHVLIASGFPVLAETLAKSRHAVIALDMSEFAKMDGGLSCLSLRF